MKQTTRRDQMSALTTLISLMETLNRNAHGIRLFLTNNNKSLGLLTIAILVLLVAYLTGSYIAVKNCPEQVQVDKIQNALYECENKLSDASTNLQQNAKVEEKPLRYDKGKKRANEEG